jgi:hypothetical protein
MVGQHFSIRQKCPACSSEKFEIIYKNPYNTPPISDYLEVYSVYGGVEFEYLDDAVYTLCQCKECKLIFQEEIPNEYLMKILYEQWIDPRINFLEHQKSDNIFRYTKYAQEISTIIDYFDKPTSDLSFLDFGMGWGKWALMAKGFGCESFGIELSEIKSQYARENGIKCISWDMLSKYEFDFINTEQVFEHLSMPLETLIHLKNSLKSKGLLKISVPTAIDMRRRLSLMDWSTSKYSVNSLNGVAPLEHINFFYRKSLTKMAEIAGMREVFIPIQLQYSHASHWGSFKRIAMNIYFPIYRNIIKKQNYLFFQKDNGHPE